MLSKGEFVKKQLVFLFAKDGEKLSFSNDNLVVKDREGKIKHQSTCYRVFALFVVGNITITSGLIQRAKKFCFSIVLMTGNLKVYDIIGFQAEGNTLLRRKQYLMSEEERVSIAKAIVINKIANQRRALQKQRYKGESVNESIRTLKKIEQDVLTVDSISSIMGYEGVAAKTYFYSHFNNCEWIGRKPRVKSDYINTTLDIAYTMLFNYMESLLRLYGFDLYVGVLHQEFYMRKSLVCDFVEPFRPIMDYCVRRAISLRQCKEDDFELRNGSWILPWKNNKEYVLFLIQPLLEYKEEMFSYVQDFYRSFCNNAPVEEYPKFILK